MLLGALGCHPGGTQWKSCKQVPWRGEMGAARLETGEMHTWEGLFFHGHQ